MILGNIMKCRKCGRKLGIKFNQKGKVMEYPYKSEKRKKVQRELRFDFFTYECVYCDRLILSKEDITELHELLKKSYRKRK